MPLFSLTDITFSGSSRTGSAATSLAGSTYDYNLLRYPSDLGNYDKGHYILFHINEQVLTQFGGEAAGENTSSQALDLARRSLGTGSTTLGGNLATIAQAGQEVMSKLGDAIKNSLNFDITKIPTTTSGETTDTSVGLTNEILKLGQQVISGQGLRTTKRTKDTVALYMPDTLTFTDNQRFGELEVGNSLQSGIMSAVTGAVESFRAGGIDNVKKNLAPFAADAVRELAVTKLVFGQAGTQYLFGSTGLARNPMMEVLYTSPQLRSFRFDFMFYPRSESEAREVQNIIERIRFHQAPEFLNNSGGYYLIPPSEFDIKFMYNGMENPNIPKINGSCVLESVDLDFAPNGFAAYESVGDNIPVRGGTGTPVAIRMSLAFKETSIVTKQDFDTAKQSRYF